MDLEQLCGQLLVVGFEGPCLSPEIAGWLSRGQLGGVILFKRNLPNIAGVHELTRSIVDITPHDLPPFIGVDQEGGRVARLPEPALQLPPMRVLGRIGDAALVRRAAAALGGELRALGFNIDFAPVLDVDSNSENPIIGDRAFASTPDGVARLGRAFIEGLTDSGVLACGKHFPGHGDTSQDSHLALPYVLHDKARLDAVELAPFRSASLRGIPALMTAHVVYEQLDPGVPATLSRRICNDLLRSEIGFSGVLFSDDLEMRALSDRYTIEQSAVAAIEAGCDALLICTSSELRERAHRALCERALSDRVFRERCSEATARSLAARRAHPPKPVSTAELERVIGGPASRDALREIQARAA